MKRSADFVHSLGGSRCVSHSGSPSALAMTSSTPPSSSISAAESAAGIARPNWPKDITDRGISHEIVRHRLASYSQESTRYVNYKDGICVIKPSFWSKEEEFKSSLNKFKIWEDAMRDAEKWYRLLIDAGAKPEEARAVLPNSLKTEIVVTMNLREWRHFFHLRCSKYAHPQIREVSMMILSAFQKEIPVVFDDFNIIQDKMIAHTDIIPAS